MTVRIFNIFAGKYICNLYKYSDGGMPIQKCTWILLLLSPCDCDSFQCGCGPSASIPLDVQTCRQIIPSALNKSVEIVASRDIVVRSPRLAAIGVATLSGLIRSFRDRRMTPDIAEPNNDEKCASKTNSTK